MKVLMGGRHYHQKTELDPESTMSILASDLGGTAGEYNLQKLRMKLLLGGGKHCWAQQLDFPASRSV